MEDAQAQTTTYELEVIEMLRIDAGCRIDLQRIVVVRRVFEKAVERVKHFVRQQEEELSVERTTMSDKTA